MSDLRIRILKYYKERKSSTEEHSSNSWLEKQSDDLGAIRRAIIELITEDFLIISNATKDKALEKVEEAFNTTAHGLTPEKTKLKKSSKRLIQDVDEYKKIPEYKFFTTVKGIKFIIEFEKLKLDKTIATWQRIAFWPLLILSLFLGLVQILNLSSKENASKHDYKTEIKK